MKKIVLLGDSIRQIGYGNPVAERLSDEFTVWQPKDNCRFAEYTMRMLWDYKADIAGADIIHWNNGLWDVATLYGDGEFTPIDMYIEQMVRLAKLLKERAKVVIFATTTPVSEDNKTSTNATIEKYNRALVPKLEALGVRINDLYTPLRAGLDRYLRADKIHLSEEGVALATELVERAIREAAETLPEICEEKNQEYENSSEVGAPI